MDHRDKANLAALGTILLALLFIGVIIYGIASWPTCKANEVMVRGVWGYVCVEGHK